MQIASLIPSLEPRLREMFDDHLERAKSIDWSYSDYLPLDAFQRDPDSIPRLSPTLLTAVELALLTEANLPWFTTVLSAVYKGSIGVLQEFVHTWTAEEDQHSLLLEVYLLLGRNGDPKARMALRKQVVRTGLLAADMIVDPIQALVYTAIQERATQIYYQNVAQYADTEDPMLARTLRRLAKDETLHYTFYRDAVKLHLNADPNWVWPVADVLMKFEMPGRGSPGYQERADVTRNANIYGPEQFFTQVIDVMMKFWDIENMLPTYPEAREAQLKIIKQHKRLASIAAKMAERRERNAGEHPKDTQHTPGND